MRRGLFVLLAAVTLAGCSASVSIGGGPDIAKLKRAIARTMQTQLHLSTRVTCPAKPSDDKGTTFTCLAHLAVGSFPVRVTVTDDNDNVHFTTGGPVPVLDIPGLQHKIAAAIAAQRNVDATVRCPATVLERQGLGFTCTATAGTQTRQVRVTQTDGAGNVHFKVL